MVTWIPVDDSERVVAVAFDADGEAILVRFPNGVEWCYEACPAPVGGLHRPRYQQRPVHLRGPQPPAASSVRMTEVLIRLTRPGLPSDGEMATSRFGARPPQLIEVRDLRPASNSSNDPGELEGIPATSRRWPCRSFLRPARRQPSAP